MLLIFLVFTYWLPYLVVRAYYSTKIVSPQIIKDGDLNPEIKDVLVFGARVYDNFEISPILEQRMLAAVQLNSFEQSYRFFLSGTERANYEVRSMAEFLVREGVDSSRIYKDDFGIDSGDTCRHAAEQNIKSAIVVTQRFHLYRVLWLCAQHGIDVSGLDASQIPLISNKPPLSLRKTLWIRLKRHSREAGLIWLQLVGLYDAISNEAP